MALGTNDEHLVFLTYGKKCGGQLRIDAHQIMAFAGIWREVFAKWNLAFRSSSASRIQGFVRCLLRLIGPRRFSSTPGSGRRPRGRLGRLRWYILTTTAILCLGNSRSYGNGHSKSGAMQPDDLKNFPFISESPR